jgi:hypothetical protein
LALSKTPAFERLDKMHETFTSGWFLKKSEIFSALLPDPEANNTIFFIVNYLKAVKNEFSKAKIRKKTPEN